MAASKLTHLPRPYPIYCGSELAREKRLDNAFIQTARVIVDDHRCDAATRQASSYRGDAFTWDQVGS
jgi:hypothetical protein